LVTDVFGFIDGMYILGSKGQSHSKAVTRKTGWIQCLHNYWS